MKATLSATETRPSRSVDPIAIARDRLLDMGIERDTIDALDAQIQGRVQEAVENARKSSEPSFQSVIEGVYAREIAP